MARTQSNMYPIQAQKNTMSGYATTVNNFSGLSNLLSANGEANVTLSSGGVGYVMLTYNMQSLFGAGNPYIHNITVSCQSKQNRSATGLYKTRPRLQGCQIDATSFSKNTDGSQNGTGWTTNTFGGAFSINRDAGLLYVFLEIRYYSGVLNTIGYLRNCTISVTYSPYYVIKYVSDNALLRSDVVMEGNASTGAPTPSKTGYTFNGWYTAASGGTRVCGGGGSYTPSGNVDTITLYAQYTVNTYTIGVSAGAGGTVSGGGTVNYGGSTTITASPNTGYRFVQWNDGNTSASRTISNVAASATYTATFAANTYTVTLNNQSATAAGTTSVTATYNSAMPPITKPTRAYAVTFNYNGSGQANGSATASYTFGGYYTAANGGGTQYYTATGASARAYNIASATTLYAKWTSAAVTLPTPNARTGYTFSGWYTATSGGSKIGNAGASYTPTAAITLYAQWAVNSYSISTAVSPTGAGSVTGGGTYNYGATATITATASAGYSFSQWQDGNTNATRTITVTGAATYTAIFSAPPQFTSVSITPNPANAGQGVVLSVGVE